MRIAWHFSARESPKRPTRVPEGRLSARSWPFNRPSGTCMAGAFHVPPGMNPWASVTDPSGARDDGAFPMTRLPAVSGRQASSALPQVGYVVGQQLFGQELRVERIVHPGSAVQVIEDRQVARLGQPGPA